MEMEEVHGDRDGRSVVALDQTSVPIFVIRYRYHKQKKRTA